MAKRKLRFEDSVVQYGGKGPSTLRASYGAARYVRLGGNTPTAPDVFSPVQNAVIFGSFEDNQVVWPPADEDADNPFIPASVKGKHRGGGGERDPAEVAREFGNAMREGMDIAAALSEEIAQAKEDPAKVVLNRQGSTQAIEPSAMEPDNGNAWYDAETRTLHLLVAAQSPYEVARVAAFMVKDNKKFPVEQDRKSTRLNSSHVAISYAVFCLKKK